MGRVLPGAHHRGNQRERPRQKARKQYRDEKPPRLFASVDGTQEAFDVFVNEKKLREFRISDRHQREPGHRDGEKYQRPNHPFQRPQQA